eukprot:scaffold282462_cov14-Tisochrysis_lutea.AAC.1
MEPCASFQEMCRQRCSMSALSHFTSTHRINLKLQRMYGLHSFSHVSDACFGSHTKCASPDAVHTTAPSRAPLIWIEYVSP